MDCSLMQGELLDYHFAVAEEARRAALEEHLLSCKACLRAYLDLKRAIETPPREEDSDGSGAGRGTEHTNGHAGRPPIDRPSDRPSDLARQRLRAEVRRTFGSPAGRFGRFLRHPVPLYQAAAAFTIFLAAGLLPVLLHGHATGERPRPVLAQGPTGGGGTGAWSSGSPNELIDTARQEAASLSVY